MDIRVGIQNCLTGRLASDRLVLKQRRIGLLLQRSIHGSDGHDQAGRFLRAKSVK